MSDLKLTDGDLDITAHRASLVRGEEAIEQALRIRLQTFEGEWFLDTRIGVPMYSKILVKNADLDLVEGVFRRAIELSPGIRQVLNINLEPNPTNRTLEINFQALMDNGAILQPSEPFVIEV